MVAPNFKCRRDLHDMILLFMDLANVEDCCHFYPCFIFFFFLAFVRSRSRTNLEQVNWGAKCVDGE